MNLCFITGKIISDIIFKFVLNSNNISISYFNLMLLNDSIINVKAYNELADYCYAKLKKEDIISFSGYINSDSEIIIEEIE